MSGIENPLGVMIRAWTGGSRPRPFSDVPKAERQLVRFIFRREMALVKDYWGDYAGLNETALDSARIHWRRARYDAHATLWQNPCVGPARETYSGLKLYQDWDKGINDYTYGKPGQEDIVAAMCRLQAGLRALEFIKHHEFLLDAANDSTGALLCHTSAGDFLILENGAVITNP